MSGTSNNTSLSGDENLKKMYDDSLEVITIIRDKLTSKEIEIDSLTERVVEMSMEIAMLKTRLDENSFRNDRKSRKSDSDSRLNRHDKGDASACTLESIGPGQSLGFQQLFSSYHRHESDSGAVSDEGDRTVVDEDLAADNLKTSRRTLGSVPRGLTQRITSASTAEQSSSSLDKSRDESKCDDNASLKTRFRRLTLDEGLIESGFKRPDGRAGDLNEDSMASCVLFPTDSLDVLAGIYEKKKDNSSRRNADWKDF